MTWWDGQLTALDLETTSADPEEARIVQAAVVQIGPIPVEEGVERDVDVWEQIVDPGVEIPDEAAQIHGITTKLARADGISTESALGLLVIRLPSPPLPLVVFNARYDLTVLDRELRRHDAASVADQLPELVVIDPFVIDKHLERYRRGSRKLMASCQYYRALLDGAHAAGADAIAAVRLAWVLGRRGEVVRRTRNPYETAELGALRARWHHVRQDARWLHDEQVLWAADQAASLEEYFERKGTPEHVAREWPIIPVSR